MTQPDKDNTAMNNNEKLKELELLNKRLIDIILIMKRDSMSHEEFNNWLNWRDQEGISNPENQEICFG